MERARSGDDEGPAERTYVHLVPESTLQQHREAMNRALLFVLAAELCVGCARREEPPARPPASPDAARPDARPSPAAVAYATRPAKRPPGPEVCADCHPDETDNFHDTGMGRSLYRPKGAPVIEDFSPAASTVKHAKTGVTYRALVDGDGRWWQEETLEGTEHRARVEVRYIVGSGNHTRSYLGEVEGEVVQLPLTWYARRRIWDMSPGYVAADHPRFSRVVVPRCIFCHNDLSPHVDGTDARYEWFAEGISCTRCHGDGAAHVAARVAGTAVAPGQPDPTILNPRRADPQTQLRICQQCHLTGVARVLMPGRRWDHYDPREPLGDYLAVYVPEKDGGPEFGISAHGERLRLSACFEGSGGQLACTRCHNPHAPDARRSRKTACLECHEVAQCGDAHGKQGQDCSPCHMYRGEVSDIPHVSFTDHFIRRRPRPSEEAPAPSGTRLVDALASSRTRDDPRDARERMAIAQAQAARLLSKTKHAPHAVELLQAAAAGEPGRVEVLVELGHALTDASRPAEAAAAFARAATRDAGPLFRLAYARVLEKLGELDSAERVLREALATRPDLARGWRQLGNLNQGRRRPDPAEAAYAKAEALAPRSADIARDRGFNALRAGRLADADRWLRAAVARDGADPANRYTLATLALTRSEATEARAHLATALRIQPDHGDSLFLLARLDVADGDLAGGRRRLDQLLKSDPRHARARVELSRLELRAGAAERAREVLVGGLSIAPDDPVLLGALQRLVAGQPP